MTSRLALLLLLCSCGAPLQPAPSRDDPAAATARFLVALSRQDRFHELELHRHDGSAAMIWTVADATGKRRGTTRLDLRLPGLEQMEFLVDPAAEQAVYLRHGEVAGGSIVLMLPRICTRLRL